MRTPIKAIRAKCIDCCAGQVSEVRKCPVEDCPLHPYRMGKRPSKIDSIKKNHEVGGGFSDEIQD